VYTDADVLSRRHNTERHESASAGCTSQQDRTPRVQRRISHQPHLRPEKYIRYDDKNSHVNKIILQDQEQDLMFQDQDKDLKSEDQDQDHRPQDQDQRQDHSRNLRPIMPTKSGTVPFQTD